MSTDDNKAVVRRYVDEVWNRRDLDLIDELLAPDYKRYMGAGGEALGRDGQRNRISGLQAAFPDVTLDVQDLVAEGDRVVFRAILRGTHRHPFQGVEPTGRPVAIEAVDVVRVSNGRLVEHWGVLDMLTLLRQIDGL